MQRFNPTIGNSDYEGEAWATMQADPFGEYVDHDEAQATIAARDKEIAELRSEVERLRALFTDMVTELQIDADAAWNDAIEAAVRVLEYHRDYGMLGLSGDYLASEAEVLAHGNSLHYAICEISALKRPTQEGEG